MTINLDEIKARAEAATAGPWKQSGTNLFSPSARAMVCQVSEPHVSEFIIHKEVDLGSVDWRLAMSVADFIAHARTDVPALVAEVERLRMALEEIQRKAHFEEWQMIPSLRSQLLDIAHTATLALECEQIPRRMYA